MLNKHLTTYNNTTNKVINIGQFLNSHNLPIASPEEL